MTIPDKPESPLEVLFLAHVRAQVAAFHSTLVDFDTANAIAGGDGYYHSRGPEEALYWIGQDQCQGDQPGWGVEIVPNVDRTTTSAAGESDWPVRPRRRDQQVWRLFDAAEHRPEYEVITHSMLMNPPVKKEALPLWLY